MSRIINNTNITFTPSAQQEIRNAAANCGVDTVTAKIATDDGNNDTLFNFYDEESNYLFSFDTEGEIIFERQ